jgi:hypothetical protein
MAKRMNFTEAQRQSAFDCYAQYLMRYTVDGILIQEAFEHLRQQGRIYYCQNCLFCHTDQIYFDVDHLVPDRSFRLWGKHPHARDPVNMIILCKSRQKGDLGCNQSKGANNNVPKRRGLAFTHPNDDMNCYPVMQRPFIWT